MGYQGQIKSPGLTKSREVVAPGHKRKLHDRVTNVTVVFDFIPPPQVSNEVAAAQRLVAVGLRPSA